MINKGCFYNMDASYFFDKFIEFKTLTKQQKLKIKHFQRDYHNDIDLLPNACMAYILSIYTPHKYKRNMYAVIILVNNKTSYDLSMIRHILIVIRLCFRANYRKFDVPRIS